MKKFFDMMDPESKGYVTIDDYVLTSERFPALKRISNSLFKHFDREGSGTITFLDMLKSMTPGATKEDLRKMEHWV